MARPVLSTESETVRLHMMITAKEVLAINAWRHTNGVSSLSEAVRQLVALGLLAKPRVRVKAETRAA